jgi:hypothetical protein
VVLLGAGEDAGADEVVWLAEGMSGVAVAAGFSMLGWALVLEACSGTRGALKERKHQVSNQSKRYVREICRRQCKKKRLTPRQQAVVSSGEVPKPFASFVPALVGV